MHGMAVYVKYKYRRQACVWAGVGVNESGHGCLHGSRATRVGQGRGGLGGSDFWKALG